MNARSVALVVLLALAGCTTARYAGSVGRDRSFVNRGYGFLVRLSHARIGERFDAIVPENRERFPAAIRPKAFESPLDLDADGFLDVTETTRHFQPALRLLSRTSTAVFIDVDVQILSKKNNSAPLIEIALGDAKRMTQAAGGTFSGSAATTKRTVAPNFDAVVFELPRHRVAVIDQSGFEGEEGITRRQIVRVTLHAPRIDESLRAAHDDVLDALILNRRGSVESTKEEW